MKKLLALYLLLAGSVSHAQNRDFEQARKLIRQKVSCCAVPFHPADPMQVSAIEIENDGSVQITYSSKKPPLHFNLLQLYKETETSTGMEAGEDSRLMQFHLGREKTATIRFAKAEEAQQVHAAFQKLYKLLYKEKPLDLQLDFKSAVDAINIRLEKWAESKTTITAKQDGTLGILSWGKEIYSINYFDLGAPIEKNTVDSFGMEPLSCSSSDGKQAWLKFYLPSQPIAFIRLKCLPDAELNNIHVLFKHLLSLCTPVKKDVHLEERRYFISRSAALQTSSELLANSLRGTDKKDAGDTTITVYSRGEGWLDKDSMPIGEWQFFARDGNGKEYLFKKGVYTRTSADLFEVRNLDSVEGWKHYHLSFRKLREEQVMRVPFIKTKQWQYFHPNGQPWKTVHFQSSQVPIYLDVVITTDGIGRQTGSTVYIRAKEDEDEYISGHVHEFDDRGRLYKKLEYFGFSEVYKKTLLGKNGEVLKEEKARPYEATLKAENY